MCFTEPCALVHNKNILDSQRKFRIDQVLHYQWDDFNLDVHRVGSFVAWELDNIILKKKKFQLKYVTQKQREKLRLFTFVVIDSKPKSN